MKMTSRSIIFILNCMNISSFIQNFLGMYIQKDTHSTKGDIFLKFNV